MVVVVVGSGGSSSSSSSSSSSGGVHGPGLPQFTVSIAAQLACMLC